MKLNNGLTIRLLGIKQNPSKNKNALDFLKNIVKGQKVFLKYDIQKYDNENNLMCYVYLKNKTFINAHLIKKGLVLVDSETSYKHKEKFQKLYVLT